MQPGPGPTFEVIEAEFLLELLMRLFTNPPGLDCRSELFQAHIARQVRHIVFLFAGRPAFANEPDLVAPACTAYDCRACGVYAHPQREHDVQRRDMSAGLSCPAAN